MKSKAQTTNATLTSPGAPTHARAGGLLAGGLGIVLAGATGLAADTFIVDSNQSQITLSGNVLGADLEEQAAGSLTTHYQGTLVAEVGADTIQFAGQSLVTAMDNGSWEPTATAGDGSEPANYGAKASAFASSGVAALRNLEFDVTSASIVVANGQFDSRDLIFTVPADSPCSLAYRVKGALASSGVVAVAGQHVTGEDAGASLAIVGDQQVLTIPIHHQLFFSLTGSHDTTITLTGQLVATRSAAASRGVAAR